MRGATAESFGPTWGSRHSESIPVLERQTALIEFLDDLIKRLLTKVGHRKKIVLGLEEEFTDGVHLGTLEAITGTLGKIEILDKEVEIGRTSVSDADLAELETLRLVAHFGHKRDQRLKGCPG